LKNVRLRNKIIGVVNTIRRMLCWKDISGWSYLGWKFSWEVYKLETMCWHH